MTSHAALRRAAVREDALARLSRMEVGDTLQIAETEAEAYRWARDQLTERVFSGVKGRDGNRAWWDIRRVS